MKLSKTCKMRIKRLNNSEAKAIAKAAALLADIEAISDMRFEAIMRSLRTFAGRSL